jgi:hypothetical protein
MVPANTPSTKTNNVENVTEQLNRWLPQGSFTVLLRSYSIGGDARNLQHDGKGFNQIVIMLRRTGREAAIQHKAALEELGFQVSSSGDLTLNYLRVNPYVV